MLVNTLLETKKGAQRLLQSVKKARIVILNERSEMKNL